MIDNNVVIANSIVWGGDANRISGTRILPRGTASRGRVTQNILELAPVDVAMSMNNVVGMDPMFVDIMNMNACVRAGSPAINAGSAGAIPNEVRTDIQGNARIVGTIDIGACEQ